MPMKIVPPVVREASPTHKFDIGPLVLMAGFMTKKTRALNRWKQRWWQLLDNGFLLYYKSDDRSKLLGQIDIARTCYDVRLGSERCQIDFPRAAPSCCCISFAVLKRTYYVYTPTAGEAKRWSHTISNLSRVINRRIVAGVEHRKAPDPPSNVSSSYHIRMTRVKTCGSCEDLSRIEYIPVKRTEQVSNLKRTMATSIPDYLDKIGDGTASLSESLDSRMWLDSNSPQQTESQVHPREDRETMNQASWAPEEQSYSALIVELELAPTSSIVQCESVAIRSVETTPQDSAKKPSLTSVQKKNHFSSPASLLKEFENLEDEEEKIKKMLSDLDGLIPRRHAASVSEMADTTTVTKKPTRLLQKSGSLDNILQDNLGHESCIQSKPIPKPRKGKAKLRRNEKCSSLDGSQKNRKRTSRLKFSPPSTPPPPPPQLSLSSTSYIRDTESSENVPPFLPSPPLTRYCDSGPPSFTAPPPPPVALLSL